MKKTLLMLTLSFALVAPLAHADVVQDGLPFKAGYYPNENGPTVQWINPLFNAIKRENPSCIGFRFIINNVLYDFTK